VSSSARVHGEVAERGAPDDQPQLANRVQMRAAGYEGDVMSGARKLRAVIAPDRAGTDDRESHQLLRVPGDSRP
jgi:hypothetical protein